MIAVDCNTESGEIAPGHPAFDFLSHELAARSEPWLVVASHYPMRSGSRQGNRSDLLRLVEHHGMDRVIPLGPKAQAVLAPFLSLDPLTALFSPKDAERETAGGDAGGAEDEAVAVAQQPGGAPGVANW